MKLVLTNDLQEGMVVAEDIYGNGSKLLVPKNVVLTKNIILLLVRNQIVTVKVEDEIITQEKIQPASYMERLKNSTEFTQFQRNYEKSVAHISESMNDLVEKNIPFETDRFLADTMQLMHGTGQTCNVLDFLISMRNYDDSTFCHSINVSLLCGLFSDWLHLDNAQKEIAMICGLFHDIGKLQIPVDVIQKPGKLTDDEFSIMRKHAEYGYHILSRKELSEKFNEHVKNAALMHHEKCDGTGYPLKLKSPQIDFYAKMVAICDVYDAMTSARVYRKPLCPFTVIDHFEDEGLQKYDPEMLLVFLEHVVNTYINHTVKLSNGQVGNIIFINKVSLAKPTIKCDNAFIDLSKNGNVFIETIL